MANGFWLFDDGAIFSVLSVFSVHTKEIPVYSLKNEAKQIPFFSQLKAKS